MCRGRVRSEYKLLGILVSMDPPHQNTLQFNERVPQTHKRPVLCVCLIYCLSLPCYSLFMKEIVQRSEAILRQKAKPVPHAEICSAKIMKIIADMSEAMSLQKDGIAIAAPQIGVSLRIFVVSGSLLKKADKNYTGEESNMVFINPEILKLSKDKKELEEGCLSVRWLYGKVKRSTRVTIRAYNENGEKNERGASGLLAQIFQHEHDHLEGILFTDKADQVWEMSPEEIEELQRKN